MKRFLSVIRDIGAVFAALVVPIGRSFRQNSGLAVFSIVLAFGVWIVVSDAENPETTLIVESDIPVEPVNIPSEIAVADLDPQVVRVRVRVEEDVLDTLTAADFEATLDLEGFTVGDFTQPVDVRPLTSRGGLRIEEVLPPDIDVALVPLITKSVPVVIELEGKPPSGFSLSFPEPEQASVNVRGPQSQIDQVTQVTASISVEGATESIEQAVRLEPRDRLSALVPRVAVDPSLIEVTVEIMQQEFSRPVVVSPKITGSPAEGFRLIGVTVDPATVTVTGPESFIKVTVDISTDPISISNADGNIERSVNLVLPDGVVAVGDGEVTVTVLIAPLSVTLEVPLNVINVGNGLSVVGTLPTIQVTVSGAPEDLIDLDPTDISVTVDVDGQGEGSHVINVELSVPDNLDVDEFTPDNVTISLVQG